MSLADDIAKQQNVKPGGSDPADSKAWATVGLDGGELSTGAMPTELAGDWDAVLRSFGLDPTVFEVADDTVRMSKWQSSKRLENGDRDLIWLYSYKARFRRKSLTVLADNDIDEMRSRVAKWKPSAKTVAKPSDGVPCTFVFNWADLQLGKSAGRPAQGLRWRAAALQGGAAHQPGVRVRTQQFGTLAGGPAQGLRWRAAALQGGGPRKASTA